MVFDGLKNIKIGKDALKGTASGILKSVLNTDNIKAAYNTLSATNDAFMKARTNAKITGKVLGHYLALGNEFQTYSISLIGFSLGSQVIKSCLNTIAKIGIEGKT